MLSNWFRTVLVVVAFLTGSSAATAEDFKLVMFEEDGCYWCETWKSEIGPKYGETAEGKLAPVEVVDIDEGAPEDLVLVSSLVYTPTFVLFKDGYEVGKIEGYPGEDFFWWFLEQMLEKQSG